MRSANEYGDWSGLGTRELFGVPCERATSRTGKLVFGVACERATSRTGELFGVPCERANVINWLSLSFAYRAGRLIAVLRRFHMKATKIRTLVTLAIPANAIVTNKRGNALSDGGGVTGGAPGYGEFGSNGMGGGRKGGGSAGGSGSLGGGGDGGGGEGADRIVIVTVGSEMLSNPV